MSFLYKRKVFRKGSKEFKTYWYIGYYEKKSVNGKLKNIQRSVSTGVSSKAEANIKLQMFINRDQIREKRILCSEFLTRYIELGKFRKPQHIVNIKKRFSNFILFLGDRSLEQYTTEDIDYFLSKLSEKFSPYTVKGYRADLHAGFQQALKWKYIKENVIFYSHPVKVPEPEILFFSKEEFNLFINSIDNELFRDIAIFTLYTGLRAGDIVNIKLSDIFLPLKYIRITATNSHNPKNQKTNWTEIADDIIPMLEKYIFRNRVYLFETLKFNDKLSTNYLCNKFKLLVNASPIDHRHSHKSLRKTFASWLLESTNDFSKVYPHLHHSSPRVGMKHYAKLIHPVFTGITNLINYKS